MLHYFRNLRKSYSTKFLKYALGEIILVMLGILFAVQIDNWNQLRIERKKELGHLKNLKEDLLSNINRLQTLDSIYQYFEASSDIGIKKLNSNPSVDNILEIDSLVGTRYAIFPVNRSTYNEMLNDGSFYSIKNQKLRSKIDDFYVRASNEENAFIDITRGAEDLHNKEGLNRFQFLIYALKENIPIHKDFETEWIKDPNSETFLALMTYFIYTQSQSNRARRMIIARYTNKAQEMIEAIDLELKSREN